MTTATGLPPNVEAYLGALRAELSDLAAEEREDLLSEVEPSLLEAAGDGDDPIAARLGPAADFAADLRASAGLPPAPRAPAPRPGLRAALAELADSPRVLRVRATAAELAPLWWAVRAVLSSVPSRSCSVSAGRSSGRSCPATAASPGPSSSRSPPSPARARSGSARAGGRCTGSRWR